jgi:hypothetical protein
VVERPLGDHALLHARDVRGGDVHEVRRVVARRGPVQVSRAEQVRLEPLVDRRVEADGRRRVDHDVDARRDVGLAAGEVAVDHVHALVQQGEQGVVAAESLAQSVERGLPRQVMDALHGGRGRLGTHQDRDTGLREVEQQALEDDLPEEPGDPRQQDALAREGVDDGAALLYHAADYALSTVR